jgi:DNA-binding NtrC family response regulator
MRLKVLLIGDDPVSLVADGQLLKERGLMVFSAFNMQNITEIINEVKPDVLFFDPQQTNNTINETYNSLISNVIFNGLPIIFTLTEDDMYLVTRKRSNTREKKNLIADNMIDAVKMALRSSKTYYKKAQKVPLNTLPNSSFGARA